MAVKLAASVLVHNEARRYLFPFLAHLCAFCDEVRVLDDGSTDDWADHLHDLNPPASDPFARYRGHLGGSAVDLDRIHVLRAEHPMFFTHEGEARNQLLQWTFEGNPTHVLAIDADEFVTDGPALRRALEEHQAAPAWTLQMCEVWKASEECVCVRYDGQWSPRPVAAVYRAPGSLDGRWRVADRKLAPGREPMAVRDLQRQNRCRLSNVSMLHLGWANQAERVARHARYTEHDGGRFHANLHLDSILWPDRRVELWADPWPDPLHDFAAALAARINE